MIKMDDGARSLMLGMHNDFRNRVALENNSCDMKVMSYSKELEFVGQCWANTCPSLSKIHDNCRSTKQHVKVGQNVYLYTINSSYTDEGIIRHAFQFWEEVRNLISEQLRKNYVDSAEYTRTAQILWAKTYLVGCGRVRFGKGFENNYLIVCNYAPLGNVPGEEVYGLGKPCSRCEVDQNCNQKYSSLCGEIAEVDNWEPPFEIGVKGVNSNQRNVAFDILYVYCSFLVWRIFIFNFEENGHV